MRRLAIICVLSAALAAALAAAVPAGAAPVPQSSAKGYLHVCQTSLSQGGRYAVFGGWMKSLSRGTDRMEMRFDLYRRAPGGLIWRRVAGPGLGVWNRADAGVAAYRFRQRVENLPAPYSYRALVSYRWKDAAGRVFARTARLTPTCFQPDLRPDLRIGRISAERGPDRGTAVYSVVVRNDGRSAASDFDVVLNVNGQARPAETLASLAPGQRTVVRFTAPRCTGGEAVVATVDPDNRVAESRERNNAGSAGCAAIPLGS
jgi:CARDB protein